MGSTPPGLCLRSGFLVGSWFNLLDQDTCWEWLDQQICRLKELCKYLYRSYSTDVRGECMKLFLGMICYLNNNWIASIKYYCQPSELDWYRIPLKFWKKMWLPVSFWGSEKKMSLPPLTAFECSLKLLVPKLMVCSYAELSS